MNSGRVCDRCGREYKMGSGVCVCGSLYEDQVTLTEHVVYAYTCGTCGATDTDTRYASQAGVSLPCECGGDMTLVADMDSLLRAARDWISDCEWADITSAGELSDTQVMAGVDAHYFGGWSQFISDGS